MGQLISHVYGSVDDLAVNNALKHDTYNKVTQ